MTDQLFSFGTTLTGAIVGGVLAVWGSIQAVKATTRDLELAEIRRQKVECLANLSGLRFTINDGQPQLDVYKSQLMFELNRIPILWSEDPATLRDLRDFYAERTNDRFFKLIRSLGRTTKFPMENLSDADIRQIFLVTLSGR